MQPVSQFLLRHKLHEKLSSITYSATDISEFLALFSLLLTVDSVFFATIAATLQRFFSNIAQCNPPRNDSCNLSGKDFKRSNDSRGSAAVAVVRQVARIIAQCDSIPATCLASGEPRGGAGLLRISNNGDDRRIFWGLKFSIPGFFF